MIIFLWQSMGTKLNLQAFTGTVIGWPVNVQIGINPDDTKRNIVTDAPLLSPKQLPSDKDFHHDQRQQQGSPTSFSRGVLPMSRTRPDPH